MAQHRNRATRRAEWLSRTIRATVTRKFSDEARTVAFIRECVRCEARYTVENPLKPALLCAECAPKERTILTCAICRGPKDRAPARSPFCYECARRRDEEIRRWAGRERDRRHAHEMAERGIATAPTEVETDPYGTYRLGKKLLRREP